MENIVKILSTQYLTHNVKQFRTEKPPGYHFTPGQATELTINQAGWKDKKNPFTFTGLADDPFLEFMIKIYPDSDEGVTSQLSRMSTGDELILYEPWGAIAYKGPGYFIAGGSGITPFIAILRQLNKEGSLNGNKLFFSNRTDQDIILAGELKNMLGPDALFLISDQEDTVYDNRRLNLAFLKAEAKDLNLYFYLCGPDPMMVQLNILLTGLGAKSESVVFER
jgi:ferredoxin-NADP reductase